MNSIQVGYSSRQVYPKSIVRKPEKIFIHSQASVPVQNLDESPKYKPSCSPPSLPEPHVHEFEGSTKIAESEAKSHNHRFTGVTSQVIPAGDSHVHVVFNNTDFFGDHHHDVAAVSGLAVVVGDKKHVHFIKFITTLDDGHFHEFQFATLIQNPLTN